MGCREWRGAGFEGGICFCFIRLEAPLQAPVTTDRASLAAMPPSHGGWYSLNCRLKLTSAGCFVVSMRNVAKSVREMSLDNFQSTQGNIYSVFFPPPICLSSLETRQDWLIYFLMVFEQDLKRTLESGRSPDHTSQCGDSNYSLAIVLEGSCCTCLFDL